MWRQNKPAVSATYHFPHLEESASGAFSIEFCLKASDDAKTGYQLQFTHGDKPQILFKKNLNPATDNSKFRVVINTHLIPNGPVEFKAAIVDAKGRVAWSEKIGFTVNNPGPLAAQVRESMQTFATPLFVDEFLHTTTMEILR
jgi:hypothetical protein